jgi:P27 family predicted phage terminase small subunit
MQSALERMLAADNAVDGPLPDPPSMLDDLGRIKWLTIAPVLQVRGDCDQGTLDALVQYCSAWSRWRAAEAMLSTHGVTITTSHGNTVASPWLAISDHAQRQVRQWAQELGLTPLGRKKLRA